MTGWNKRAEVVGSDVREALALAHKELSELAQTKGLSPDGERARDMCGEALKKLDRGARRSRGR